MDAMGTDKRRSTPAGRVVPLVDLSGMAAIFRLHRDLLNATISIKLLGTTTVVLTRLLAAYFFRILATYILHTRAHLHTESNVVPFYFFSVLF